MLSYNFEYTVFKKQLILYNHEIVFQIARKILECDTKSSHKAMQNSWRFVDFDCFEGKLKKFMWILITQQNYFMQTTEPVIIVYLIINY